jgi:excinuclease ABC subunit A
MSVREALDFFTNLKLSEREGYIARQIIKEIKERLRFW